MTVTETTSPGLAITIATVCAMAFAWVWIRGKLDLADDRARELGHKLARLDATGYSNALGRTGPRFEITPRFGHVCDDQGPDKPDTARRGARPPDPWPRADPLAGPALVTCAYCSAGVAPNRRCGNCGALAPVLGRGATDNAAKAGEGLGNVRPSEPVAWDDR